MKLHPTTLRGRLVMLVLVAILPLFGLAFVRAWLNANTAISEATEHLQVAEVLVTARQNDVIDSARHILLAITQAPGLVSGSNADCQRYLQTLKAQLPEYANLVLASPDGTVRCDALGNQTGVFLGDRDYFKAALAQRRLVASGYLVGRMAGKSVVIFALPALDREEKVSAVALVALDLSELSKAVAEVPMRSGSELVITDRQGIVLAANPEQSAAIGQRVPGPVLQEAVRTLRSGSVEGPDGLGRQLFFAFQPIGESVDFPFYVAVSMDRGAVTATVQKELALELILLALLASLGGWLAWGRAGRAIVKPTTDILEATGQLQQGQLDVRIAINPRDGGGEFSKIALSVNHMADALQAQREALQAELARSQAAQEKLRDAQRLGRIGFWQIDLATKLIWWSDEVYDVLGVDRTLLGSSDDEFLQLLHPDDRAAFDAARSAAVQADLPLDIEFRIVTAAGQVRWIHLYGRAHEVGQGEQATHRSGVLQDITGQHEAQAQMRLLETCITHLNDIVLITEGEPVDGVGRRAVFVNDAFERITGYRREEALGKSLHFLNGPRTDRAELDRIRDERNKRKPIRTELINYTRSGEEFWVELDSVPVSDARGVITYWVTVGRDITHRKQAEQALHDSERRYAALFDAAPVPMYVFASDSQQFLAVNPAAIEGYGYSAEEFLAMTLPDIHDPAQHELLRQKLADESPRRQGTWRYRRKDGSIFPGKSVAQAIEYAGRAARFVVALDTSAQVKAENDMAEHLFTLQRAADAAQAIAWHQTLKGALQEVADQARGVIGAHMAVVSLHQGNDWAQAANTLSLSDKYARYRDLHQAMDGSGIYALVCETNHAMRLTQAELEAHPRWRGFGSYAGKHPTMRGWLAVPLTGHDGKNIGLLQLSDKFEGEFTQSDEYVALELAQLASGVLENARLIEEVGQLNSGLEQKVAERTVALARQEAMFRALSDQAPQVVWTADARGAVTYLNRAWFELVGGKTEDWLGGKWYGAVHPEDLPVVKANWLAASTDLSLFAGIRRICAKDGSYHTMAYRASPVLDEQGEVQFWVGIDADITEVKAVEAALRLANRELETFSYSVSHDLRSPLNTIDGFSQLLARQLAESGNEKVRHYLARIQAGTKQMGQLIGDLLALSQVARAQLSSEPVDLSALARSIADDLLARQGERQVALHIESGLHAEGDAGLLRVVLENLLGNAWKFSAQQARAEISVGQTLIAAGEPVFFVRDNGVGFDMAYADKLYTPFQRLHLVAEFAGTGIGLATVKRVIDRHGGRLWTESAPGRGATFYFTLPKGAATA
ncbi:MAG: PAS domain S-box protein [Polaromonas sp.]